MDILKPILDIYDTKKEVLLFYLDATVKEQVEDFNYLDDENNLFLNDKISFLDIPKTIEKTVKKFQSKEEPSAKDLIQLNQEIKVYLDSNYHDL